MSTKKKNLLWLSLVLIVFIIIFRSLIFHLLASTFTYLGYNSILFLDSLFEIKINPIFIWSFWGLLIGSLVGVIIAIKKFKLSKLLVLYPIVILLPLILLMNYLNSPLVYSGKFIPPESELQNDPEVSLKRGIVLPVKGANIRNGPGSDYQIITTLSKGVEVIIIEKNSYNNWYKIRVLLNNKTIEGYIHSSLLKSESEFTNSAQPINHDSKIIDQSQAKEKAEQIIQTIEYPDGSKYIGIIKNGKKEGKAIFYFPNGNRFEGNFKNNLKQGKGVLHFQDGSRAEGVWVDDLREGEFTFFYSTGNSEKQIFLNGTRIN